MSSSEEEVANINKVPYANTVGSLMYLMVCTHPDIGYEVSVISRFWSNPGKLHWEAAKWMLRYLCGTKDLGLLYGLSTEETFQVIGIVAFDFAKDLDRGYIRVCFSGSRWYRELESYFSKGGSVASGFFPYSKTRFVYLIR